MLAYSLHLLEPQLRASINNYFFLISLSSVNKILSLSLELTWHRDGHGSAPEENWTELNQTFFKIHNNRTELLKWFCFIVLNQTITNVSLKQTELFQFSFKIVSYGSVSFCSVWFSLAVRFGYLVFLPTPVHACHA
jgi:hypothetical protein